MGPRPRHVALSIAALLLASGAAAPATLPPSEGDAKAWRVALRIDTALAKPSRMFEAFDTASLNLYDFDKDGQLEIVANNDNNRAYVLDPRTGGVLAEIHTFHHGNSTWGARELNPIAIGDLYGDGVPCMVIPNTAAYLSAWCFDKARSNATRFEFTKKWEIPVDAADHEPDFHEKHPWILGDDDPTNDHPGMDGHAYLADADGDGKKEVFIETDGYPGQFAFGHDGTYRWSRSFADGNAGARVLDVDKDGQKEAIFAGDAGLIVSYTAKTGAIEWTFDTRKHGASPGSVPVPPLIADLDGNGMHEIVFGARVAIQTNDPQWINQSHARYYALDGKGRMLWNVSYDWMNPLQYNHPAPLDVNGDGTLDVVFLDWNTIGQKPGKWNTTNRPSNLFALNGKDGSLLWRSPISVFWSNKDFVVADVDGDGKQEIVAPTGQGATDGLGVYDLRTGARSGWFPSEWQLSRGPVAGDLYGDGKLSLVVPVAKRKTEPNYRSLDVGYREGAILIVETGRPYDVAFSANFLWSEDQKEPVKAPPKPTPTPTPTTSPTPTSTPTPTATPTPRPPPTPTAAPTPTATPTLPPASPTPATPTPPPTATPTPVPTPEEAVGHAQTPGPAALALVLCVGAAALATCRRDRF